jgi:hypothetical protein
VPVRAVVVMVSELDAEEAGQHASGAVARRSWEVEPVEAGTLLRQWPSLGRRCNTLCYGSSNYLLITFIRILIMF